MTKITLTDLVNLENQTTAVNAINTNNAVIETAFDNTLSRDGTAPNTMGAAIDMNSNQIYNLPAPSTINSPARLIDVTSNPTIVVPGTGTSGHTVPFLDGNNTWSGTNAYSLATTFTGAVTLPSGQAITNAALTNPTMTTPVLGTPTSGTLTNTTGFPTANLAGAGAGVLTFLATPSSANLATAVTGETGSGGLVFATTPTLVTPVIGVATGTSLAATGAITSSGTTGVGYATGAGGTVTQITSRTTGVTINKTTGAITLFSAAGTNVDTSFVVTNSTVAATDVIILNEKSGTNKYKFYVSAIGASTFTITFWTDTTSVDAPVINFAVIKGVIS